MEKILFIGGDRRSIIAMEKLKSKGYFVSGYGLTENDFEYISDFDIIVTGVPTTRDSKNVFCPISNRKIPLSEIESNFNGRLIITSGYNFKNKNCVDILSLDSYAYLNAVPTAEGALCFAIENTDFTLWKSKILVIGNGRVGKILASRLKNFGCDLTVSARKQRDFCLLDAQNINFAETSEVLRKLDDFDIVFNTVDFTLPDDADFKKTLLIDLSSKGCIDFEKAKEQNKKAFKLPSLPSKTAFATAGEIFASTVIQVTEMRDTIGKELS